jgi:1-acyl-sn-glycerol-3-phosphate acyltransferase
LRGRPVRRAVGRAAQRLLGWRVTRDIPQLAKFVAVAAPHTSNWDFVVCVAAMFALDVRVRWLGKHTLFRWPFRGILHALGGYAVKRDTPDGIVEDVASMIRREPQIILGLAPEGTRKRVSQWRTGFYRIATAAGVPIVPVRLDWGRREIWIGSPMQPTSDMNETIAILQANYAADMARHPKNFWGPVATALLLALLAAPASAQGHWFRGNTHTHTLNSDGDSPPDSAARWYRDHGYSFLFITDHEKLTDPAPLNERFGKPGQFLLIVGQEVTQRVVDSSRAREPRRQAHMNSLGGSAVVMPQGTNGLASGITMAEGYARNIAAIRAVGAIPQINHPNFRWSVQLRDLLAVPDSTLFEIANAHTGVNNQGGVDLDGRVVPSAEALWDSLLTRGRVLFAIGDDDAHSYKPQDNDAFDLTRPGRSWIMVRADTLTAPAILSAIRHGDFYASTGVTIKDLSTTHGELRLAMDVKGSDDRRFTTEFIGRGGRVLATVPGPEASYKIRGNEGYVRARVVDSNGRRAWTQAVFVGKK